MHVMSQYRPTPTLFPYTTLFRSPRSESNRRQNAPTGMFPRPNRPLLIVREDHSSTPSSSCSSLLPRRSSWRSEEHTSELQSRENLVCRLLLEKKKRQNLIHISPE